MGVGLFLEVYTYGGTLTDTDLTVNYVNQAGQSKSTTQRLLFGGVSIISNSGPTIYPVGLATGDYGVRQVVSCSLASSAVSDSRFGFTLARILAFADLAVHEGEVVLDPLELGLPDVSDACLSWWLTAGLTNGTLLALPSGHLWMGALP